MENIINSRGTRYQWYWKSENIFLILATIFIGVMIIIMPLNRVPDESTHAVNAWRTVYSDQKNSFDWGTAVKQDKKVDEGEYKKIFHSKVDLSKEKFDLAISKGKIQYTPQILGMLLGKFIYPSVGVIMTFGRLLNSLFYILSVYFIVKYMKYGKRVLVFTSLLPISIQQAASLSYDVFNFVAVAFFFAVLSNLTINKRLNLKNTLTLLFSIIGLYLTKLNNLSMLILLPFMGLKLSNNFPKINEKITLFYEYCRKRKYRVLLPIVLVIFFAATIFFRSKGGITHFVQIILNSLFNNSVNQALNPLVSAGIFGFIGNFHMQFPLWLFFIDISVLTVLMIGAYDEEEFGWQFEKGYVLTSSMMFPLQMLLVIGGMYFSWTKTILGENAQYSTGTQGRYFTPFLIYFTPLFVSFNHAIQGKINNKLMNKVLCGTLIANFIITVYLILIVYWYPDYQTNWLIEFMKSFN
ncbi:DUF2142 domain-containing protein [Enterococcus devriesei]|uniref:DUF2142 domain-containing protein n=1 Tax=Enterococcus devriesei TaxID=319970 RepID=UPI001C11A4A8|nr:DUF2142 domain-containing protein [Enterococcus devriesei]MBU5364197.1 DUF2142 domain-containing protein [Enterococcus devriesei]